MVISFLLLTLIVGMYYSRKITSLREYAIGNKNFATATLVATLLATLYGGGALMRTVQQIYNQGIYYIIILISDSISIWVWTLLIPRMGPFMYHLSTAESIGSSYGTWPRVLSALFGVARSIITIVTQINVITSTVTICIPNIDSYAITAAISLIFIIYSSLGGIRAVTFTDVMQFITFTIVIPFFTWYMYMHINRSPIEIVACLKSSPKLQFDGLFHINCKFISTFMLVLAIIMPSGRPSMIQRIYMSSGVIQAKKVFYYTSIFNLLIVSFIILIGLFTVVSINHLTTEQIWPYIINQCPPILQASILIGLIAMTMSTADSSLNSCSTMITHDLLANIYSKWNVLQKKHQLYIVKISSIVIGLLSMIIAFYCKDLFRLLCWAIQVSVPITAAPFLLAIFGFRGTTCTALIGMTTGALTILAWNKWIEPSINVDGSFLSMLANGFAMMSAHYLLKQPENTGWIKPDDTFRQIQQENSRKREECKQSIKNAWKNRKMVLANLKPSSTTIVGVGCYIAVTSLLVYFMDPNNICLLVLQLFLAACFVGYPFIYDISQKIRSIPTGLGSLMGLTVYLPLHILWNWFHIVDPNFSLFLSLAHYSIILWVLPLYISIGVITITSLLSIYPICIGLSYPVLCSLFPIFLMSIFIFTLIICFKCKVYNLITQVIYLKTQIGIRESQQFKSSLYESALVPYNTATYPRGNSPILEQAIYKVEESISFLDKKMPLFKEDLQSIFNKLYDWVAYFRKRENTKEHALLYPTKITLDNLIHKVEVALLQSIDDPPKILVEKVRPPNRELSIDIVCDINQVIYSLVKAVLRIGKLDKTNPPIINIELNPTCLQFKQSDSINEDCPIFMDFSATAILIYESTTFYENLPKIKECYNEMDSIDPKSNKDTPPSINIEQDTIASMTRSHYGYLKISTDKEGTSMLIVLPNDVSEIRNKMTYKLPVDALTVETPVTPKEQADSMMELMKFHDHVCKSLCKEDPIDPSIISGLLLLLREHFGCKRHESGQLFYVRAVGISKLVVDWVFHSPKVVYASLLYGLVRHTCLPLSYIKQNYNLGVYAFVLNVVGIDKREELDHPSLLYVKNRLKECIKKDHVQLSVLFIKLAERLYDLRQSESYINPKEVQHMAQETLAIDVKIAHSYLDSYIGQALEEAAKQALEVCKSREKDKNS
ncbi:sodium:solute symporter family transporter [Candidatus Cardinium hertigii]|uniref:sodium:solute symporter family transporter n=1 Tax=Candidatus Cardinium hertigii TaxID=247481 RepID=UPI003D7E1F0E